MQIVDHEIILRLLMERNACEAPDREVVTFEDGERWTTREALEQGRAAADVLLRHGVKPGDVVGIYLPNVADFLRAWWGAHFLGAVIVPFNLALKGNLLAHLINLGRPMLCVTNTDLANELRTTDAQLPILASARLRDGDRNFVPDHPLSIADPNVLMATSGTTGPSKLCEISALQLAQIASYIKQAGLGEQDRFLLDLPLYHIHALGICRSAMLSGVALSLRLKPSLTRYWDIIRQSGATAASMIGTTAANINAASPSADDRNNTLRFVLAAPLPDNAHAFMERFGITKIVTSLGSTELGGILVGDPDDPPVDGSCGRAREHWTLRLVDGNGAEVPVGEVGELIVKPKHPALRSRYINNDAANDEAWRDGWFRSGDLLRKDADGNFFYVDRLKDSLRRRGENISSFEVEAEVRMFSGVADVACVAAKSDDGAGEEVKVWIIPAEGVNLDFAELARFLYGRVAKYMVPRFYELTTELPRTPTNKVQKHILRAKGNGPETWDLETYLASDQVGADQPLQSAAK